MNLRLIVNGHGSMEPIYSNTPLVSLDNAENEADVYIGTECEITVFDQDKDETVKVIQSEKIYQIKHYYDSGDSSVYVRSYFDPTDAAIYLQFKAEELSMNESICLSNLAIANGLVVLYGCYSAASDDNAVVIDMHTDREARCGDWYKNEYTSEALAKSDDKLIEILSPHFGDQ